MTTGKTVLISICIPAYNRPEELGRTLRSIDGDASVMEIVICENKSPAREAIAAVVAKFSEGSKYRISYHENSSNLGYDGNLRALVSRAAGDYLVFMSDDDEFVPGALDKLASFLTLNQDVGYVLKSHVLQHQNGEFETFRYYAGNKFFDAGPETYSKLFRKSVFISGFTIRREPVVPLLTDVFDGTLLFQMYLLAEVALKYKCAYFDEPLALAHTGGVPSFGSSESEKKLYTPGVITVENSLNFLKGFFRITGFIDQKYSLRSTAAIKRDMSKYFYPNLAIQRHRGVPVFWGYFRALSGLGFNCTPHFYLYFLILLALGRKNCDFLVRALRKVLGKTPEL